MSLRFSRILLKLSGEALAEGEEQFGHRKLLALARVLRKVVREGVQVGIVVGAGNIFRARSANLNAVDRVTADHVGMLGTIMNGAILRDYLRGEGLAARVLGPREVAPLVRPFARDAALAYLRAGEILIFAGGTGNPYFTTDSAAALRALEIGADALLKATQVDGVYDKDPHLHEDAVRFDQLTYDEAISRRLAVMDLTAFTLCADRNLPVLVFDIDDPENLLRAVSGRQIGTWITKES